MLLHDISLLPGIGVRCIHIIELPHMLQSESPSQIAFILFELGWPKVCEAVFGKKQIRARRSQG